MKPDSATSKRAEHRIAYVIWHTGMTRIACVCGQMCSSSQEWERHRDG